MNSHLTFVGIELDEDICVLLVLGLSSTWDNFVMTMSNWHDKNKLKDREYCSYDCWSLIGRLRATWNH